MQAGFRWVVLSAVLALGPCRAAGTDTLEIGGTTFKSTHIEKWYVTCTTDKIENRSSCSAELNAFDLPEPKKTKSIDAGFYLIAHRVDIHVIIVRGVCASYIRIDGTQLKKNPATTIKLRNEKMDTPYTMERFRDVGEAGRLFPDDNNLSLHGILSSEGVLYIKTVNASGSTSFSVSANGYKKVCRTILAKERELNSGH